MKKGLKIFLIIVALGVIVGASSVYYVFNKPHRDVEGEKPAYTLTADVLYNDFNSEEETSTAKYANQVIQVTGNIVEISSESNQVSLVLNDEMEGVSCALDSMSINENKTLINSLKMGDKVTLKGKCDGFDMIMGVVLTNCFLIN